MSTKQGAASCKLQAAIKGRNVGAKLTQATALNIYNSLLRAQSVAKQSSGNCQKYM